MGLGPVPRIVCVLMMCVMNVGMGVLERIVDMLVHVAFGHVEPDSPGHQDAGYGELPG